MESVQVEIYGHTYTLKAIADPGYIRDLAAFVDAKMKDVQRGTGTVEPQRVAILAALNMADELFRLRADHDALEKIARERVRRLFDITAEAEPDT